MRFAPLASVMIAACLMASVAEAETLESAKTSGYTNILVTQGNNGTQYWYDFTLVNNSDPLHPFVDCSPMQTQYVVLADRFAVDLNDKLGTPVSTDQPTDWTWKPEGFERFTAEPNEKYHVPPSVAPNTSLSGFRYSFDSDPGVAPEDIKFSSHVLAVNPTYTTITEKDGKTYDAYGGLSVCLPGYGDNSTWFDSPQSSPAVPEASTLVLALTGMVGPVAMLRRRRS